MKSHLEKIGRGTIRLFPVVAISMTRSWDFGFTIDQERTIEFVDVARPWKVYLGETINLIMGQTLLVNAHRIGYSPSEATYTY